MAGARAVPLMPSRRVMLGAMCVPPAAVLAAVVRSAESAAAWSGEMPAREGTPEEIARDESYWFAAQQSFTVDRGLINLNNGGVSPAPWVVQRAMQRRLDEANTVPPPIALWQTAPPLREAIRARLARQFGCDTEEIAITRNASESLQACQFGFDLQRGDEVVTTTQDYPRMLNTFKQRERREGIVLKQFKVPVPCEDASAIVALFEEAITDRTRLILMSHTINITGQILPVKRVVEMARRHGVPVIVDGAHALAHLDFKLSDLDCDYYGSSLHKWLFAPIGTGLLYVRKEKIGDLWPLMAASEEERTDIRKFEQIGTHPAANFLAIAEALTFHQGIGPARKEARLRYLRDSWAERLLEHDRVKLHTSLKPEFSCGIATVQIEGVDTVGLHKYLWDKHRILTVAIVHDEFNGIRVSPSVYTTLEELDRFVAAMETVIKDGLPA